MFWIKASAVDKSRYVNAFTTISSTPTSSHDLEDHNGICLLSLMLLPYGILTKYQEELRTRAKLKKLWKIRILRLSIAFFPPLEQEHSPTPFPPSKWKLFATVDTGLIDISSEWLHNRYFFDAAHRYFAVYKWHLVGYTRTNKKWIINVWINKNNIFCPVSGPLSLTNLEALPG